MADRSSIGELARRIRADVFERTGLQCSIGISDNKQRAKMATGFAKKPEPVSRALAAFDIDKVYLLESLPGARREVVKIANWRCDDK